ncbi:uncharacterized protein LY79DRAFT_592404 [Colletotrichum navitas]|uniref:Uncharacterized protein n=1 Tax=Colletotrichum navitas TaxID=681940 RepID=A0AAD8PTX0_9PEZI|nr:uncharacterized protein LY79DRAFT_592404 [Colletotrichum navitas]KAK1580125.1 hypothetical protein LY79DRAFT_592404 [Colletotrichum navitas]
MQFSKVLLVLFPVAVLAAPFQTFKIPTLDPNTVAPEVPAIDRRIPPFTYVHIRSRPLTAPGECPSAHGRYHSGPRARQPHILHSTPSR